jgi:hypothetical protein
MNAFWPSGISLIWFSLFIRRSWFWPLFTNFTRRSGNYTGAGCSTTTISQDSNAPASLKAASHEMMWPMKGFSGEELLGKNH